MMPSTPPVMQLVESLPSDSLSLEAMTDYVWGDMEAQLREHGEPLRSLETWRPLGDFDVEREGLAFFPAWALGGGVAVLLDQNIAGEQCAISVYSALEEMTRYKDPLTYNMVLSILQDEVNHEEELQALLEDLDVVLGKK